MALQLSLNHVSDNLTLFKLIPSFLSQTASVFESLSNTTGTMVGIGRAPESVDEYSFARLWLKLASSTTIDSIVLLSEDEVLSAISLTQIVLSSFNFFENGRDRYRYLEILLRMLGNDVINHKRRCAHLIWVKIIVRN